MECVPLTGTLADLWSGRFGWYSSEHSNQTSSLPVRTYTCICTRICIVILSIAHTHVNERCRRKEESSKQDHTNNKAKQHSTYNVHVLRRDEKEGRKK